MQADNVAAIGLWRPQPWAFIIIIIFIYLFYYFVKRNPPIADYRCVLSLTAD